MSKFIKLKTLIARNDKSTFHQDCYFLARQIKGLAEDKFADCNTSLMIEGDFKIRVKETVEEILKKLGAEIV